MLLAFSLLGVGVLMGTLFLWGQRRGRSVCGIPFLSDRATHPRLFWTAKSSWRYSL
jgi:hypothetical protein